MAAQQSRLVREKRWFFDFKNVEFCILAASNGSYVALSQHLQNFLSDFSIKHRCCEWLWLGDACGNAAWSLPLPVLDAKKWEIIIIIIIIIIVFNIAKSQQSRPRLPRRAANGAWPALCGRRLRPGPIDLDTEPPWIAAEVYAPISWWNAGRQLSIYLFI